VRTVGDPLSPLEQLVGRRAIDCGPVRKKKGAAPDEAPVASEPDAPDDLMEGERAAWARGYADGWNAAKVQHLVLGVALGVTRGKTKEAQAVVLCIMSERDKRESMSSIAKSVGVAKQTMSDWVVQVKTYVVASGVLGWECAAFGVRLHYIIMAKRKKTKKVDTEAAGKSHALQIRMTPELFGLLQRAADLDNRSVSQWIRLRTERVAREELGVTEPRR
jgi:hypothetical protein